jgi:hypothetical protein
MPDAWPGVLPQCFTFDSFSEGVGDGRLRSTMDAGPAKVRGRSSASPGRIAGQMRMTREQWDALMAFGRDTLLGWSLPFNFPFDGEVVLARFGENLPSRKRLGPQVYMVELQMERLP